MAILTPGASHGAAGDLDSLNLGLNGAVYTCVEQPDGKMLLGGDFTTVLGQPCNRIARLNADGTLDSGFNPGANGKVLNVTVQADGKVLLGGEFTMVGGTARNRIARLSADGTLDSFDPNANNMVLSVAVQPDGKVLLGGEFTTLQPNNATSATTRNHIARVNADGTLDSFDPNSNYGVYSIALQPDGKVVLGGTFTTMSSTARSGIARVNADGTLDSFNPNANGTVFTVVVQADGKVLLGGNFTTVGGTGRSRIARVNADGTLDSFNPNASSLVSSIAVQADGKVLLGGSFGTVGGTGRNRVARVNADGTLESFNPNLGNHLATIFGVSLQADGKVLLAGSFITVGSTARTNFARLLNNAATQTLAAVYTDEVSWQRGGASPEVAAVTFELSTDGGMDYSPLGSGTRVAGGWELKGLSLLPSSGHLRARGRTSGGDFNGSSGLVQTVVSFSGLVPGPEIAVQGNNTTIDDGDSAPDMADHTDFGSMPVAGGTVVRTFTISNSGPGVLNLTGTPKVAVSGTHATDFTVALAPTSPVAATDGTTSFQVTFDPSAQGTRTATLSIASNDSNENPYNFAIHGYGTVPGDLDSLNLGLNGQVYACAEQPDGKLLLAGTFTTVLGQTRNRIARLNADGTLDSFNPNVTGGLIYSVALQADGKVLLGGSFTSVGGTARNYLARVNADGTLDSGFTYLNPSDTVASVVVQPDGKVLVGGLFWSLGGTTRNMMARLNANGTLDSFNPNVTGSLGAVASMAVQADGKVLLAGSFTSVGGTARNHIARVNANGTLDSLNPNADNTVSSVVLQADGKMLLGGNFTTVGGTARNRVARLNADGTLDSFNPNVTGGLVNSVALQADGKVLLGGEFTTVGVTTRNRIARLNADGTLDSFNPNVSNANASVYGVAVRSDGKVLLGGNFTTVGGTTRNYFVRLLNDEATQSLATVSADRVSWQRGGAGPEVTAVTFELSTDGGTNYRTLGSGTRVAGGSELNGLTLPSSGHLRAWGRTAGGKSTSSSGLVQAMASFSGLLPEIALSGNSNPINDGDTAASLTNHTDFGSTAVAGSTVVRTFTISNSGNGTLNLTGTPKVAVSGTHAADFTVTSLPATPVAATNGSTTFQVTFDPSALDLRTATLSIANDDSDEGSFEFAIQGTGLPNTAPVLDASKSPALAAVNEDVAAPSGAVGTLVSTLVDFASPTGQVDNVTDPDAGALLGIALTAVDTANGTLYYSLNNGSNWTALGAVSDSSALLLAADATTRLYFRPNANVSGTLTSALTFRAWDQTSGTNGTTVDASSIGGTTPFSTATDTVSQVVTGSNDAPVLDNSKFPALAAVNEDAGAPSGAVGTLVSVLVDFAVPAGGVDNVTDPDPGAVLGIAVTATTTTNGAWWFSTNNGGTWTSLGTPSATAARLLAADANTRVYFQPNANFNGAVTSGITFRAWDVTSGSAGSTVDTSTNGGTTAFSTATNTASVVVSAVNDAPVLDASKFPTLAAVNEDAPAPSGAVGTLVSALVDFASPTGQVDNVTDPDTGAQLGIAVTVTTSGTLWYSLNNGGSWTVLSTASQSTAVLLAADASTRLYYQPSANYNGTLPSLLTFRAWDQSSGSNGAVVDANTNGGSSAFSSATDFVALTVNAVNDAPVLDISKSPALAAVNEDAPAPSGAVGTLVSSLVDFASPTGQVDNVTDPDSSPQLGIAVTGTDTTSGLWFYSTNNGANWTSFSASGAPSVISARLLAANANTRVYFQPSANFNGTVTNGITFRAWDQTSGTAGTTASTSTSGGTSAFSADTDTASVTVTAVNDMPTDVRLAPASIAENNAANATVGTLVAVDVDVSDNHSFTFVTGTGDTDNGSFTIAGTDLKLTPVADFETKPAYSLRVEANDGNGGTFAKALTVTITNVNEMPSFTKGADQRHPYQSSGAKTAAGWAASRDDGDSTVVQALAFNVSNNNTGLFSTPPAINGSTGNLTYTLSGASGVATVSVSLTDDSSINGTPALTTAVQTFTIAVDAAPDYTVSTSGNVLVVTDVAGNDDALEITSPANGEIQFAASGRTFSLNGGLQRLGDSGGLPLASVPSITVNAGAGADTINVAAIAGQLPTLVINGGAGDDAVNLNGDLTFAAHANLDLNLQNDESDPGVDTLAVAADANIVTSAKGSITAQVSKSILMLAGSSLETADGDITIAANQQGTPTSGSFVGVQVHGLVRSTGMGLVSVSGSGGSGMSLASGVEFLSGSSVSSSAGTVTVTGIGGAGSVGSSRGVFVAGSVTSGQGSVSITGTGGTGGLGGNYGVLMERDGAAGSVQEIRSSTGNVTVTGYPGDGIGSEAVKLNSVAAAPATIATTPTGSLTIAADTIAIASSAVISNPGGTVNLRPTSAARPTGLGAADNTGILGLSDAELDCITCGSLVIGSASGGNITFSAAISPAGAVRVDLVTGGAISNTKDGFGLTVADSSSSGILAPGAPQAVFNVSGNHNLVGGSTLSLEIGGTIAGEQYDQLSATGSVNIGDNVALNLAAYKGFVPQAGQSFTLINRTGGTGIFTGLAEGAVVSTNFLGSGLPIRISYMGGNGDDVVLSTSNPDIQVQQTGGAILADNASTVDFGMSQVGGTGSSKQFTITNVGSSDLILGAFTFSGGDFSVNTAGMSTTVAPNASTSFTAAFSPTASGTRTAVLHIASNISGAKNPFDITFTGSGFAPYQYMMDGQPRQALTNELAPNTVGSGDGTEFEALGRGAYLAPNGVLGMPGTLKIGVGGVTISPNNFQGYWKDEGSGLKRVLRSGDAAPGTGGAVYNAIPTIPVPGLNSTGQLTLLAGLRIGTGSPAVTSSSDTAMWSEVGGSGMQLLLREDDPVPGISGAFVSSFGFGCYATATTGAGTGEAAFAIRLRGSSSDTALLRSTITGPSSANVQVVARENATAPGTGESFGFLASTYTSAVRMDAQGNMVFAAQLKPSGGTGVWYQPRGGSVAKAAAAGDAAPGTGGATFQSFEMPSMGGNGVFAVRAFLNRDGDNTTNARNDGIWRGALGALSPVLRRGDTGIAGLPAGAKVGNPWTGWLNQASHGAWRAWVDTAGDGISPYPADTYGIFTDVGGAMRLLISSGDPAPGVNGASLFYIDHPVISGATAGSEHVAFLGTFTGNGVTAGTDDKGVWRSANGASPVLLMRTGSSMTTTQNTKTVADIDIPGSNMDIRPWEQTVMDNAGRLLVIVTFTDGSTSQIIIP